MTPKLIRIKNVIELTGKSRSAIYADMANGTFPRPIAIGTRSVAWQLSEVDKWIESKIFHSAS